MLLEVLQRVGDYAAMKQLGDFTTLGRLWAGSGRHTALFKQLGLVQSDADRLELLA